mgnify:CR=1 FL=1
MNLPENTNGENSNPQVQNSAPSIPDTISKYTPKLFLLIIIILIILFIFIYFLYQNYFYKLNNNDNNLINTIDNQSLLYFNENQAISFQYPKTLYLVNKNSDGNTTFPVLYFKNPQEQYKQYRLTPYWKSDNFSNENSRYYGILNTTTDSITFSSSINAIKAVEEKEKNSKYYNQKIYKNEINSQPFQINNMETVEYYSVDQSRQDIQDLIFIKDQNFSGRIISVIYKEIISDDKLPTGELNGEIIKQLFNQEQYGQFLSILSSIKTLPIDTNQLELKSSKELGISFLAPKYWGDFVESIDDATAYGQHKIINLSFNIPIIPNAAGIVSIEIKADNPDTAKYGNHLEGLPYLFQYAGQPLKDVCQKNGYLDSAARDIKLNECYLKTLPSGIKAVFLKGEAAPLFEYGYGMLPPEYIKYYPFKGIIFQSKSNEWPGMNIYKTYYKEESEEEAKLFDKIINSLSYST